MLTSGRTNHDPWRKLHEQWGKDSRFGFGPLQTVGENNCRQLAEEQRHMTEIAGANPIFSNTYATTRRASLLSVCSCCHVSWRSDPQIWAGSGSDCIPGEPERAHIESIQRVFRTQATSIRHLRESVANTSHVVTDMLTVEGTHDWPSGIDRVDPTEIPINVRHTGRPSNEPSRSRGNSTAKPKARRSVRMTGGFQSSMGSPNRDSKRRDPRIPDAENDLEIDRRSRTDGVHRDRSPRKKGWCTPAIRQFRSSQLTGPSSRRNWNPESSLRP